MKAKVLLAVVVCTLLALIALPVLADTLTMYVSKVRLAYNGRSSTGTDIITGLIYVRDEERHAVAGADVAYEWTVTYADATSFVVTDTATTLSTGYASVSAWYGKATYQLCVIDIQHATLVYAPEMNVVTCATFTVP